MYSKYNREEVGSFDRTQDICLWDKGCGCELLYLYLYRSYCMQCAMPCVSHYLLFAVEIIIWFVVGGGMSTVVWGGMSTAVVFRKRRSERKNDVLYFILNRPQTKTKASSQKKELRACFRLLSIILKIIPSLIYPMRPSVYIYRVLEVCLKGYNSENLLFTRSSCTVLTFRYV